LFGDLIADYPPLDEYRPTFDYLKLAENAFSRSRLLIAIEREKAEVRQEGSDLRAQQIARVMLAQDFAPEQIADRTGLRESDNESRKTVAQVRLLCDQSTAPNVNPNSG